MGWISWCVWCRNVGRMEVGKLLGGTSHSVNIWRWGWKWGQMKWLCVFIDDGGWRETLNRSYAVCSIPGAGLALFRAVSVEGSAAGLWVVGEGVRDALWVIALREGRASGHLAALFKWAGWHCLLTVKQHSSEPRQDHTHTVTLRTSLLVKTV